MLKLDEKSGAIRMIWLLKQLTTAALAILVGWVLIQMAIYYGVGG